MKTKEIRRAFLDFFASRGHEVVSSSSLIPAGDPTLLFANAGMVQFKDCFLGTDKRAYTRATTCQKSLRISGKHNDLENVGRTARHHTFFEMLGNFSFGDYFKEDAIKFAWEFLCGVLELPKERLWVTVFEDDDEAAELWRRHTDVLDGRILRFGEKENFWAMGDTGPCGPCSEIHYYLGDDLSAQSEEGLRAEDGSYIEIWNLVFMQFNREPNGNMSRLPRPSVDTGMGLERVAAVKQGMRANYDNDLFRLLISFTEELSGMRYDGSDYRERDPEEDRQYAIDVALRVIADHVRAASFLIADGVNPASDGRGYVLRRIIRRACRHGRVLGLKKPFLCDVSAEVVRAMGEAYADLPNNAAKIAQIIRAEEEKFLSTLDTGMGVLGKELRRVQQRGLKLFPGETAFLLHDTYGFPLDLTDDILSSHGIAVDHERFSLEMEKQRERSRLARESATELMLQRSVKPLPARFVGYEFSEYESEVLGIFEQSGEIEAAREGQEIAIICADTPFYGESGGQVGDTGRISSNTGVLDVIDTRKLGESIVHVCRVLEGDISVGTRVRLAIDAERRERLRAHHSATHLLHLALRQVLGEHVKQSGSRVSDQSLRFDFSHNSAVSLEQLEEVEVFVNREIRQNHPVTTEILPLKAAMQSGAVCLFDEKYGETVRVVQMGPLSREFCGGTHVSRTGDIGLVSVVAEGSIASGVRRIEAFAGSRATERIAEQRREMREIVNLLNTSEREALDRVKRLLDRNRELEREVDRLHTARISGTGRDLTEQAVMTASGTRVIASVVEHATPKQLREMADDLRQRLGSGCVGLAGVSDGKAIFLAAVTADLRDKYRADVLVREVSKILGGSGGGRPDLAQSGGGDPEKIEEALRHFQGLI